MLSNIGSFLNSLDSAVKDTLADEPKVTINKSRRTNNAEPDHTPNIVNPNEFSEEHSIDTTTEINSVRSLSIDDSSVHSDHSSSGAIRKPPNDFSIGTPEKSTSFNGTFPSSNNLATVNNSRPPPGGTIPSSASKTILLATASDIDNEMRKTLKEKSMEIKQLHRELTEVEEEKKGLELELRSAWDNYKQAQEKAAAIEGDLQDELRQVLRAKDQEKQQAVAQIAKLSEDVALAMRQVVAAQLDRDEAIQRLSAADQVNSGWAAQVQALNEELQEARSSTVQGVHNLREELRLSQTAAEQMRHDHHSVVRQNQARLAQLEMENSEVTRLLAVSQREIASLKTSGGTGEDFPTSTDYLSRDYQAVQQEVIRLSAAVEGEQELRLDAERRAKQLEFEARATQLNMEDERRRNADALRDAAAQIASLEDKVKDMRRSGEVRAGGVFSSSLGAYETNQNGSDTNGSNGDQSDKPRGEDFLLRMEVEVAEAKEQARNLSQLLLKKQGMVVELQAERSALKARCLDLQARCSKAEQSVSAMRDLEDGTGDDFHDTAPNSSGGGGAGLQRRGAGGGGSTKGATDPQSSRVISDLEKMGVKPGARVVTAVNWIDSWALLTGRFLRSYPLFRLGFVLYLVLMHVWVFFILLLHMETLDLDSAEGQQQQMLHPQ